MAIFLNGFKQFFVDDTGELSCMRLCCFVVNLTVLGNWTWGCYMAGAYVPLGMDAAGLLGAVNGAKAAQTWNEFGPGARFQRTPAPRELEGDR